MSRRTFVTQSVGTAAAIAAGSTLFASDAGAVKSENVTADALLEFFLSKAPWVKRETTVDRVIAGDPKKSISKVLVCWMPSLEMVKVAIEGKYDLLLTHEPTFYDHLDYRGREAELDTVPIAKAKKKLIEDSGLVILRNHDVWDLFPEIGIPFAWAKFLGFTQPPVQIGGGNYMHRYDIEPIALEELAKKIAKHCAKGGEPAVQVCGPADKIVSKVGIGTGCATNPPSYQGMGCDVGIVSDDGTIYWKNLQRAADEEFPFIRIHHGTSEVPGMETLAQYVRENFPSLTVDCRLQAPVFRTVTREGTIR